MAYALNAFKTEFNRIADDNLDHIAEITKLAHDAADSITAVVRIVCGFIQRRPVPQKVLGLFVLDSIVKYKSSATFEFRRAFTKCIVGLFVETFEWANRESRRQLYKCRASWQSIMPQDTLYQLDMRIREIDAGWPVVRSNSTTPPTSAHAFKRRLPKEKVMTSESYAPFAKRPCVETQSFEINNKQMPMPLCNNNVPANKENKPMSTDVMVLLNQLKASGVLNKLKTSLSSPPPVYDAFSIENLSIRNPAVIEALHAPRQSCHHCGIAISNQDSEAFRRHVDAHVRQLLDAKVGKTSESTTWFMPMNAWLAYDELAEVQKDPSQEIAMVVDDNVGKDISSGGASPSDAISTSSLNKNCTLCHEKFVEYFDDDEEEWRFQDGVVSNGLAVHRSCLEQMGGTVLNSVKKEISYLL